MSGYVEEYQYDAVGNFLQLIHQAANGNWTRGYIYTEVSQIEPGKVSNRLSGTTIGGTNPVTETYTHDAHGNITAMPHLTLMQWDFLDQLQATSRQAVTDGTPETTYYVYDGQASALQSHRGAEWDAQERRIYLGGFEVYREYEGTGSNVTLERQTLHVMDDKARIAIVETRTQGNDGSPAQLARWQFGNHLHSACLELDDAGQIISYEEYYPYGSTSYQAVTSADEVSLERYRYSGIERDEETGLSYHGSCYYASWLSRWTSADSAGLVDGPNLYAYARNSPTTLSDPGGRQADEEPTYAGSRQSGGDEEYLYWNYASGGRATEIRNAISMLPEVTYYFGPGSDSPSYILDPNTDEWFPTETIKVEDKAPEKREWYDQAFDFDRGIGKSLWGMVEGAYNMVRHPIKTGEGFAYMQLHPIATFEALGHGVKNRASAVFSGDLEALGETVGDIATFVLAPEAEAADAPKIAEAAGDVSKAAEGLEAEGAGEKLAAESEAPAKGGGIGSEPPPPPTSGGGGGNAPGAGPQAQPWQHTASVLEDIVVEAEPPLPRGIKNQSKFPRGQHAMRINSSRAVLPSLNRTRHAIQSVWDLAAEGYLGGDRLSRRSADQGIVADYWTEPPQALNWGHTLR